MSLNNGGAQRINVSVPLNDCPLVECAACGGTEFYDGKRIRKVSGLVNSSGQDRYVTQPVILCAACGEALSDRP